MLSQWKHLILYLAISFFGKFLCSAQMIDGVPGCRTTKLELVFLVDGSSSVSSQNFDLAKQWIRNMTLNFDISRYTTRVAVVQYSSYPRTEFNLDAFDNGREVRRAISDISYMSGNTQTGMAIRYAIERVFVRAREGSAKVAIVLSDGESQDEVTEAAASLRSSGIAVFAVGVGDMSSSSRLQELRAISSIGVESERNVFTVKDFRSIGRIQQRLIDAVCEKTIQECPTAKHDLTFVIDASSTIGYNDFMKVKEWMKKIVKAFDIGPDQTRVAVITYSSSVQEEFNFNDLLTKEEVLEAIDLMDYVMGNTRTGDALMHMLNVIYTEENGDRSDVPDLAIVITDGKAQETDYVISASRRVHDAGITVYSVGVGDYSIEEVRVIASDPDENYVIEALNFDIIELKRVGLIKSICAELEQTCPTASAEIVFLIDGSTSIGSDNFDKQKTLLKTIVDAFQVGKYYTRIALVQFTETPHLEFGLNEHRSTQATLEAIRNIRYRRGSTNIGRAIEFTLSRVLSESRANVPKILIALTDGQSQDDARAAASRAREAGVHTLVFGVESAKPSELRQMVAETDNIFQTAGFDEIQRMQSKLVSLICIKAEPECARQELDLHFLVDSSNSIGERNFEKVKTWIKNMVRSFDVGKYNTRVALTQFSSSVYPEFTLKKYSTKREVEYAIDQINLRGGATMTAQALDYIRQNGFSEEFGGRTGAPKVLIVISDGRSGESMEDSANQLREAGVYVFSVGAGYTSSSALKIIGTDYVVHVQDAYSYDAINNFRRELVGEICRETRTECPDTEMDLIFLVDGSNSIGRSDFETTKEWIVSFVREFEIGEYNTKIGVVQYSSEVKNEIDIGAYETKDDLIRAITEIEFAAGSTNTGSALEYVRNIGFSSQHGSRRGVPKVLIIITDGNAQDQVTQAARSLHRVGVHVFAIGAGRVNMAQLQSVVSDEPEPTNVLHVRNFNTIKTVQSQLLRRVCQNVQPDCAKTATDLMYLIDGSTSVGQSDWNIMKFFMQNITEKFRIGNDLVRVGVVQYSTYPRTSIEMGEYNSKNDLLNGLTEMAWETGDTYTARALRYVLRSYNQAQARSNLEATKLLIVITDGQPQDRLEVISAVNDLHDAGWRIFAIGVGQAVLSELGDLASNPDSDHVFYADNFSSTKKFQGRLTRLICTDPSFEGAPEPDLSPLEKAQKSLVAQTSRLTPTSHRRIPKTQALQAQSSHSRKTSRKSRARKTRPAADSHQTLNAAPAPLIASAVVIPSSTTGRNSTDKVIQSKDSLTCSSMWRDGKKITGVDLLSSLGLREVSSRKSQTYASKAKSGTTSTIDAYRLKLGTIPVMPSKSLLTILPDEFSLITVFRMHGRTAKNRWTLLNIASSNCTIFSVSFNGGDRSIFLSRSSTTSASSVQTLTMKGRLVSTLFDHNFHKLEMIVEADMVTVLIDCQQVPTQMKFDSYVRNIVTSTIGVLVSPRFKTHVELQDLTLKCGLENVEECCELPGKKCSTRPVYKDEDEEMCGCLPEFIPIELREAEDAVISKIATRIAEDIVQEKIANLMMLLDMDPSLLANDNMQGQVQVVNKRSSNTD